MEATNTTKTYTRKAVKEILGCSLATVDSLLRSGQLRSVRISPRRIIVPASALEEYLNGNSNT